MSPSSKSLKICTFYTTNSCKNGTSCPFSHAEQPSSRVICKHYRTGSCMFGDRCKNIHINPSESTSIKSNRGCIFWKDGRCSKGAQCAFLHEPLAFDTKSWREHQDHPLSVSLGRELGTRPSDVKAGAINKVFPRQISQEAATGQDHNEQAHAIEESKTLDDSYSSGDKCQANGDSLPEAAFSRSFDGRTQVTFADGGTVHKVQTAFESRRVTLSNIPHGTNQKDIIDLAGQMGALNSMVFSPPHPGAIGKAELEYIDVSTAKAAAVALDGAKLHGQLLTAQLNLRSADMETADLRSSTLKMSWFAPSRLAYAHYDTIHHAQQKESALNGKVFAGRKVSTKFQQPTVRQRCSFTVIIKGLPIHIPLGDLKKFCGTNSVDIGQPNYAGKEGTRCVRKLLEGFGPLESFEHSHPMPKDVKVKALVRFAKPEHAATAAAALHGQFHEFLGGARIWVTLLHSIKYNVPMSQFQVIKDEILRVGDAKDHSAKIRIYETDEAGNGVDPVCVRIYGDDPKALGRLKSGVEIILVGEEVVTHTGISLWDDFFIGEGSRPFVESAQKESGAFVRPDARRRKLYVSGTPHERDLARKLLLGKAQELRERRHRIPLTKPSLGRLLRGEFVRLQRLLGTDKLTLDIRDRTLIVQGDEEDIEVTKLSLIALETNITRSENGNDDDCPVCFCEVTSSVALSCGHSYCFACLRHYLASAENFPVKCLALDGRCNQPISLTTVKHILPVAEETRFFETAFLAYIRQHPTEFRYCPTPDCQLIYRPAEPNIIIRCFSCLARICAHCHVENHEGLTCEQHGHNMSGGEEEFKKWKEENNVHACPGCGADIEKKDGCNHITCIVCHTHMCWVCRKTFKGGNGIYQHMVAAHGDIGVDFV